MTDAELKTLRRVEELRTDNWGNHLASSQWLGTPNRSIDGAQPYKRLAEDADAIIASFAAEIAEPKNG